MNVQLKQLEVKEPCHADWNAMAGTPQKRFCEGCQKHVHDFSQMNRSDIEQLLCNSAGNLCARFSRTPEGDLMTLDYGKRTRRKRWLWPLTISLALLSTVGSWLGYQWRKPASAPVALPTPIPTVTQGAVDMPMGKIGPAPKAAPTPAVVMGDLGPTAR